MVFGTVLFPNLFPCLFNSPSDHDEGEEVECKPKRSFRHLRGMRWSKEEANSAQRGCYRSPNVPSFLVGRLEKVSSRIFRLSYAERRLKDTDYAAWMATGASGARYMLDGEKTAK
jgi:hypothetical protein